MKRRMVHASSASKPGVNKQVTQSLTLPWTSGMMLLLAIAPTLWAADNGRPPGVKPMPGSAPSAASASAPATAAADDVFFREGFDDTDLQARKWHDTGQVTISPDSHAGKGCIEYGWPSRDAKAPNSSGARRMFELSDEVYVQFRLRLSKGFGWTGKGYHPHLTYVLTTENASYAGPAKTHLTLYIEPVDGKLRLAAQDIQNSDMPHGLTQGPLRGGWNGTLYDSKEVLFKDDKWHLIEGYFKLNTLDLKNDRPNKDGIVRGWFDGKLVVERTDIILRSTDFPKMKLNQFLVAPHFGPGLLPHAQTLWIDDLTVGKRTRGHGPEAPMSQPTESAH